MHDNDTKPIIYQVFAGMCRILKEKEGIMNKVMAIDMGIGFSIFSKLLSGKRPITPAYEDKIYNYLNQEMFGKYAPLLVKYICDCFDITHTNMLYRRMASKNYTDLLHYLFYEIGPRDITADIDLKNLFMSYVRSYFKKLLKDNPQKCHKYELVPDGNIRSLEETTGLDKSCIMVLGREENEIWKEKVCILVCPPGWNNERRLLTNTLLLENYINYIVVRLKEEHTEHIFSIEPPQDYSDTLAEFETIHISNLYRYARDLAATIFQKFCCDLPH